MKTTLAALSFALALPLAPALLGADPAPAQAAAALPGPAPSPEAASGPHGREPVLAAICYHRFGVESSKDPYRISLQRLGLELDWLHADGWRCVSLTQVAAALDGDTSALPAKGVLLTIDDGYRAGALADPVFREHGFRAVYFVVPKMLGRGAFLSYPELRALEASGNEVACHTLSHADLAKIPLGMDPAAYVRWVDHELVESKRRLEAGLGHPVLALAWPYGAYNPAVSAAALRAGYRQLWSVSGGLNPVRDLDRTRLRRIILMGHPPLETFQRRVLGLPLRAPVEGITEGSLIYRSQLPWRIKVPRGVRAALGGQPLPLDPDGGLTLSPALKDGFHYLDLAEENGAGRHNTPFLFQVVPDSWKPYFEALAAPAPVAGAGPGPIALSGSALAADPSAVPTSIRERPGL
ncbi:MAG TPA: polysaccharide deacetylase family protein [bacterium]|jgi:peptidoglycan/xylan/chitin deacetylase (PgdA/CDA1 family)|nr:polysaccharide deacetylase family protein [bacterium]